MEENEKIIQVGFKIPEAKKNILMARLKAQGTNFQDFMTNKVVEKYFEENPITDTEKAYQESLKSQA